MPICRNVEALAGYVPGEQPKESGIIKLNTNENPYPPSPMVGEALRDFDYRKLRLYSDPVYVACRQRIAEINGCRPENVFVGNGSDEVLALFTRAFVETPDGTIGFFDPTYSLYSVLADIRDCQKRAIPLPDDFSWVAPPPDFEASAFLLTNPNAPTSVQYPHEEVRTFCRRFPGIVLIDEAYADFAETNCMDIATDPENTNTLVMRTLSKSFSLAGLRFGYCVGPERLIDALFKIKDSYNMDWFSQTLGLAALNDLPSMRANVQKIHATRSRITDALRQRGWEVLDSQTNFLFAAPPCDAQALFQYLKANKIFVRYFPGPRTGKFLRITMGTDEQMDRFLAVLDSRE